MAPIDLESFKATVGTIYNSMSQSSGASCAHAEGHLLRKGNMHQFSMSNLLGLLYLFYVWLLLKHIFRKHNKKFFFNCNKAFSQNIYLKKSNNHHYLRFYLLFR
mmetsp:Transcript_27844/g.47335  ORF Transcript_27844/g.47335 Transcript_27844/m.47335 type:complete len:104 (-) Transcript_27844:2240-2551(-)